MRVGMNAPLVEYIQTKFIVTTDRSLPNDKGVTINLKKGDILQGVSTSTTGNQENDTLRISLTFTDKDNNRFQVSDGIRGGQNFYEILDAKAIPIGQEPTKSSEPSTSKLFGAYNKNLILVVLAVAGYFAYKKFKK